MDGSIYPPKKLVVEKRFFDLGKARSTHHRYAAEATGHLYKKMAGTICMMGLAPQTLRAAPAPKFVGAALPQRPRSARRCVV